MVNIHWYPIKTFMANQLFVNSPFIHRMSAFKEQINPKKLPAHIAIIMDGNGRWAKKKGILRVLGHKSAVGAVRETIEGAAEIGVKFVTLFAFSTENWQRPQEEVNALMELLVSTLKKELPTLMKNKIRLRSIGNTNDLPENTRNNLAFAINETKDNNHMTLVLALNYGARADMLSAVQTISAKVKEGLIDPDKIDENCFRSHLSTAWLPDPELLIRTSGEYRISNFLLWEIAYSEIYIADKLWPDFSREDLYGAIVNFQGRERRFGKTSEQINQA